jgi:hypothetical protein
MRFVGWSFCLVWFEAAVDVVSIGLGILGVLNVRRRG